MRSRERVRHANNTPSSHSCDNIINISTCTSNKENNRFHRSINAKHDRSSSTAHSSNDYKKSNEEKHYTTKIERLEKSIQSKQTTLATSRAVIRSLQGTISSMESSISSSLHTIEKKEIAARAIKEEIEDMEEERSAKKRDIDMYSMQIEGMKAKIHKMFKLYSVMEHIYRDKLVENSHSLERVKLGLADLLS